MTYEKINGYNLAHTKKKAIKNAYKSYLVSPMSSIFDAYTKPSFEKQKVFKYCINFSSDFDGGVVKIISYNTNFFSCGFTATIHDRPAFVWITPKDNYYIYLDEID